jgi:hypothetical protein
MHFQQVQTYSSGVAEWELSLQDANELWPALGQLCKVPLQPYMLFNGVANRGEATVAAPPLADDFFSNAPPEIRREHSLHAYQWNDQEAMRKTLQVAASRDAAMMLFTDLPTKDFLEKQKLVWAWFAKPSLLMFQLRKGSQYLAEMLFSGIKTVAIVGSDHCTLFARSNDMTIANLPILDAS